MSKREAKRLLGLFEDLLGHFGPQGWWPAKTSWEVMVGAILTQNTTWTNVEKAIENLRSMDLLCIEGIYRTSIGSLSKIIRPSGYFNQKARRLKVLASHIMDRHGGRLEHLFEQDSQILRKELLSIIGIGPETADAMMLYAGDHLSFVIDTYTLRFAMRYPFPFEKRYDPARDYFQAHLPKDLYIYQEMHALIDEHAKVNCRPRPRCSTCFLRQGCKREGLNGL